MQTTTLTPVSTTHDNYMLSLDATIDRIAEMKSKGMTRKGWNLNTNKLVSSVLADYRNHFAGLYGKGERLPSDTHELIVNKVNAYVDNQLKAVHAGNVETVKRAFAYSDKRGCFEKVTAIGTNVLTLEEQKFGMILFIGAAEKALKQEESKINNNLVKEGELKMKILKLSIAKQMLEQEIAKLAEVTK